MSRASKCGPGSVWQLAAKHPAVNCHQLCSDDVCRLFCCCSSPCTVQQFARRHSGRWLVTDSCHLNAPRGSCCNCLPVHFSSLSQVLSSFS